MQVIDLACEPSSKCYHSITRVHRPRSVMLLSVAGPLALAGLAIAGPCKPETSSTVEWETAYTATASSDVAAAAATAKTTSPTSKVKGKAFDRIAFIWFENENFDKAAGDRKSLGLCFKCYVTLTDDRQPTSTSSPRRASR